MRNIQLIQISSNKSTTKCVINTINYLIQYCFTTLIIPTSIKDAKCHQKKIILLN